MNKTLEIRINNITTSFYGKNYSTEDVEKILLEDYKIKVNLDKKYKLVNFILLNSLDEFFAGYIMGGTLVTKKHNKYIKIS